MTCNCIPNSDGELHPIGCTEHGENLRTPRKERYTLQDEGAIGAWLKPWVEGVVIAVAVGVIVWVAVSVIRGSIH